MATSNKNRYSKANAVEFVFNSMMKHVLVKYFTSVCENVAKYNFAKKGL